MTLSIETFSIKMQKKIETHFWNKQSKSPTSQQLLVYDNSHRNYFKQNNLPFDKQVELSVK